MDLEFRDLLQGGIRDWQNFHWVLRHFCFRIGRRPHSCSTHPRESREKHPIEGLWDQ